MRSIEQLRTLPQMLTHGDVHLGNWYVRPDETMGLSDFQNVTRGHWSRDVAYTIATSLSIADRRAWERGLIALYIDLLGQNCGHKEDFAESWTNYRQQMLSVLAYWTVTLTPSPSMAQDMQSTETTLCFLERIGQAMEDLQTLDSFG
jgi:aminoglycoside phosphotransferase (APT) family kinase protein